MDPKENPLVLKYGMIIADRLDGVRKGRTSWLELQGQGLTEIPEEVFELTAVTIIDLSRNQLRSVPARLSTIPNLRSVNLVGNPLESLPNFPGLIIDVATYVQHHSTIDPKNVKLLIEMETSSEDADSLFELKATKTLLDVAIGEWNLHLGKKYPKPGPGVQIILDSLDRFLALETLSLRGMILGRSPETIPKLSHLKNLSLDALGLKQLPNWIGELDLERFSAIDNELSSLPDSFHKLRSLKLLNLSWNPLKRIPDSIYALSSLEELHILKCGVVEIPADILRLTHLNYVNIFGDPIQSPPAEVSTNGLNAIRDYWRQRADTGVDYLCEAKLIILGEAGAGKTSLAKKIENPDYELRASEKSTEGIDVIRYRFPTAIRTHGDDDEKVVTRDFQVNIWDFGGQEIYHATHQFFLTRRSVYVLVCDDRKEDTDFSYWLQVVEMLSDASPLLIVQNEKQDRTRDINLSSLRAQFANLHGAFPTNLDTNRGLDDVIKTIKKELENLPHVGVGLPATWKRVREALEQDQHDFTSLEEYLNICEQHGFTRREDKLQLSGYLHDLGICLHFQDDALLKNTVVLKPSWGTDAVYRVLDDPEVIAARGLFTRKDLTRIWSEEKYEGMQDELLRLMMKFQLCYELETQQAFIAPQLLSSDKPAYPWPATDSLAVRYEYPFLPKGIITRFIVTMHRLIAGRNLVWKTGVVLERDDTRAEIIEEYSQRRLRVRVSGADPRGLLAIVYEQLERLHASFPRLQYQRYLPCPCSECQAKPEPYSFALDKLIKMAQKGQPIQCHESGEMIDAALLVREVLPAALRREDAAAEISLAGLTRTAAPEVYVSYGWSDESKAIVDRLEEAMQRHGIRLLRDRNEVGYKDSIGDFMRRIGRGKCIVVVISDKYLKSEYCMFEMLEIAKNEGLRERIFPIILSDAKILKASELVDYAEFWEKEFRKLDRGIKKLRGDNLTKVRESLDLYSEIRRLFDSLTDTLRDMNALTPDQHEGSGFEELIRRMRAQLAV